MAVYHFHAKVVSRGRGQSAIAKAAYNARARLMDERTGLAKDYSQMTSVAFSGIFAPKNAPDWINDRQRLWNEVERREDASTRPNAAQLAREIELGLPHELTAQQREWLVKDFVREQLVRKGMVADVNIHAPEPERNQLNHHAHILVTMRAVGPEGFGNKVREWNADAQLEKWRERWAEMGAHALERAGFRCEADRYRVGHLDIKAQRVAALERGDLEWAASLDREATTHRGPQVDAMERKGAESDHRRDELRHREELETLKHELEIVHRQIAHEEQIHAVLNEILVMDASSDETKKRRAVANDNYGGDWTERGGMVEQQDSARAYFREVQQHNGERREHAPEGVNLRENTDAAQGNEEKLDRQRQARDQREKSDDDQVFQYIQSVTGRDYRQR